MRTADKKGEVTRRNQETLKNLTWKVIKNAYDGIKYNPAGVRPRDLQRADAEIRAPKDIRIRLKIIGLNVRSIPANRKMLERYANDNVVHVLAITESDITYNDIDKARIARFAVANYSCR